MNPAVLRPLLHVSSAAILLLALWSWDALRLVLTAGGAAALAFEALRLRVPTFRDWLAALVPVFRPREAEQVSGAAWLALGYAAVSWLPAPAPGAAILTAALADPAGAIVGARFGRGERKSWPGTAAVGVTALLALSALGWPWLSVLGGATVAAVVERWSAPLDDNLVVPIAVGVAVWSLA